MLYKSNLERMMEILFFLSVILSLIFFMIFDSVNLLLIIIITIFAISSIWLFFSAITYALIIFQTRREDKDEEISRKED